MNILITGGTGYIGNHTAVVLQQAGHRVVLLDNLSNSRAEVASRIDRITGTQPPLEVGDERDTVRLRRVLRHYRIEAVVHFAGLKAVGESVAKPLAYYDHNVAGTVSLLSAMAEEGVRRLVFSSSAAASTASRNACRSMSSSPLVLLTRGRTTQPRDVFNLGTRQGTSVLQMVYAFEAASGRPVPYRIAARRRGDASACWASPAKAQRVLGWRATRTVHEMCGSTWGFVKQRELEE